jgi:hypothetical protein
MGVQESIRKKKKRCRTKIVAMRNVFFSLSLKLIKLCLPHFIFPETGINYFERCSEDASRQRLPRRGCARVSERFNSTTAPHAWTSNPTRRMMLQ